MAPCIVSGIFGASGHHPRSRRHDPRLRAPRSSTRFYGLGYAHAQDRLWQMEFQRRVGHGRLSEIFGDGDASRPDRFLRTLGTGRAARSAWDAPAGRREERRLNAYVAGVNAFISTHHGSAAAARVHAAAVRARAVDAAGRARVGEDDGVGPEQELLDRSSCATTRLGRSAQSEPPTCFAVPDDGLTILSAADHADGH